MLKAMLKLFALVVLAAALGLWMFWQTKSPSHDRDWQALYERLPSVSQAGGAYRLRDVRNWRYAPDGTPEAAWVDVTLDPDDLVTVSLVVEPFGNIRAVAHTMLAFEFGDGSAYVASVEARREVGEDYGGLKAGIVPMHEYMFVWATERDMYANSTYFTGDDLYFFPLSIPDESMKSVLIAMLEETAALEAKPRWYNTFLSNCTNVLARAINRKTPGAVPWNKAWYLPGYAAEFLFDQGLITSEGSFAELRERSYITPLVPGVYVNKTPAAFSRALRVRMRGR